MTVYLGAIWMLESNTILDAVRMATGRATSGDESAKELAITPSPQAAPEESNVF